MRDGTNRTAKFLLPAVLGMTAGAVDVTGFLALGGLFTAHITGNLVILAAHYITGSFGEIAPLFGMRRTASARAAVDSVVNSFTPHDLRTALTETATLPDSAHD